MRTETAWRGHTVPRTSLHPIQLRRSKREHRGHAPPSAVTACRFRVDGGAFMRARACRSCCGSCRETCWRCCGRLPARHRSRRSQWSSCRPSTRRARCSARSTVSRRWRRAAAMARRWRAPRKRSPPRCPSTACHGSAPSHTPSLRCARWLPYPGSTVLHTVCCMDRVAEAGSTTEFAHTTGTGALVLHIIRT